MKRVNKIHAPTGVLVLVVLCLTFIVASCGSDDPAAPTVTNGAPAVPAINTAVGAPAHNADGVDLAVDLAWACSDPDDDALTYTVRFGTASQPSMVAEDHVPSSYTPVGLVNGTTYYWQITASDGAKATSSPVWSFTTVAIVAETITPPNTPTGDVSGEVDNSLSYTLTGGSSSEGHALEYSFDWDDGTTSAWSTATAVNHTWAAAGSYDVTARARCIEHPAAVSGNSLSLQVTIDGPENVTAPFSPNGPQSPEVDIAVSYDVIGATNSRGHTLEYRVDWGDGTFSDWGPGSGVSRTWTVLGVYDIRAQARCVDHPDVESAWSGVNRITVLGPETISTPDAPAGPATGIIHETVQFNMTGAASSYADELEIRFDWGNGIITAWTSADWGATQWHSVGTYDVLVQARCRDHNTVLSAWSPATTVTISDPPAETVGTPDTPTGPATGETTSQATFTTSTVTSSAGHLVAYVFDWGDGTDSSWVYNPYASHWFAAGTYEVRVKALCSAHPEYESAWSPTTQITITEPAESFLGGPQMYSNLAGFAAVAEEVMVRWYGVTSNLGHDLEYRVDFGDGTITDWSNVNSVSHAWSAEGSYVLRAQARCIEHPDSVSPWTADNYTHEIQIHGDVEFMLPAEVKPSDPITRTGLVEYSYSVGCGSSMGHKFEVRMDWGNGVVSDWVPQTYDWNPVYLDYTYTVSGIFEISGRARCIEHPDVISAWSPTTTITVPEFITTPTISGEVTGTVGVPVSFLSEGAVSSEGHAVEHSFLIFPTWTAYTASPALEYTFTKPGTYTVRTRARCAEHTDIWSATSAEMLSVVITE